MESPNPNDQFASNTDVSETKAQSSPNHENNDVVRADPAFEYECKYCSGKFSNKQALGGHMNAHRFQRSMEKAARNAHANAGAVMNRPVHTHMPPMINHHGIYLGYPLNPHYHPLIPRTPAQLVARPRVGMNIKNNNIDGNNAHRRGGGGRVEEDVDQPMVDASGLDLTLRVGYSNRD